MEHVGRWWSDGLGFKMFHFKLVHAVFFSFARGNSFVARSFLKNGTVVRVMGLVLPQYWVFLLEW